MMNNQESSSQKLKDMDRKPDEQEPSIKEWKNKGIIHRSIELINLSAQLYTLKEERQNQPIRYRCPNVKLDLEAVLWLEDHYRLQLEDAKRGFEVMYNLSFDEARSLIPVAPDEVIEFIHKRSDLNHLEYYTSYDTPEIMGMEQICAEVFQLWRDTYRRGKPYPEDIIRAQGVQFRELHAIWENKKNEQNNS